MDKIPTVSSVAQRLKNFETGRWAARASSLALAMVIATPCLAQASEAPVVGQPVPASAVPAASAAVASNDQIGDIVVTARRVRERLQDIPASVSAISGEQVARMSSIADIQSMVSGVTFKTFGPIPTVGIRGYGNRTVAGSTQNSTVGIFQDGVFISPPLVVLSNRVDTERVEVAKGPQSTLYGRASFTGAINIVSNDPAKVFSGYVAAGYGQSSVHGEDLWRVQGAVSGPITDTLSVRVFGLREKRDGDTYDSVTHNRGGGYNRKIGRVRVLWEPNDVVTARLTGTIMRDNLPLGLVHTGRTPAPLGQAVIFGNPFNPGVAAAQTFGKTVWDAQYAQPVTGKTRGEQGTLDLRFQTPLGELASLTDYQHSYQDLRISLDLTRLNIARGDTPSDEKRYSQEFRLSNKTGRFNYLVGLYYLHAINNQAGGKTYDLNHPSISFGPGALLYDVLGRNAIYTPIYTKTQAYAAFGQVGYDFTDKLNLTLGLRRGHDELSGYAATFFGLRSGGICTTPTSFPLPACAGTVPLTYRKAKFNATTGNANLNYKIAPDVVAYVSYSRGNSPGGLNAGAAALVNYSPQKVDAFEAGLKSQLLDRHLQLNVALFDNQYTDLQLTQNTFVNGALVALITNAGKARGRGVDLDATAVLSSDFRLGLQYTYANSKITRYAVPPAPAPQVNFTGVPLVRSPRNSVNGSATFTHAIGPGKFSFTGEESYSSSYTNDYQGVAAGTTYAGRPGVPAGVTTTQVLALYRTPGYAVTNLNASYTLDKWQLSGFVRNLFNHQYVAGVLAFDTISYPQELPGEPRTFEVSLKYSF